MLPCLGDGRQSGTSDSPSILHASPESAAGGNLAILQTGDIVKVDLRNRRVDLQLTDDLRQLLKQEKIYGYTFEGKRHDTSDRATTSAPTSENI